MACCRKCRRRLLFKRQREELGEKIKRTSRHSANIQKKVSNGLTSLGGAIFCGTPAGVFKTTDKGKTWVNSSNGLANPDVRALTCLEKTLVASTDGAGIFISSDGGNHWSAANNGIPANVHSRAIIASDKALFAGTNRGTYRKYRSRKNLEFDSRLSQRTFICNWKRPRCCGSLSGEAGPFTSVPIMETTGSMPVPIFPVVVSESGRWPSMISSFTPRSIVKACGV